MVGSAIDVVLFAPLAPLCGVVLLWFIQMLFIEWQKCLLSKIKREHPAFCRFTNFMGILFQTICHAMGYTATKSGIAQFKVTVHYGKVKPKREKGGVFEWVSNAFLFVGPFFIPPLLVLICFASTMREGISLALSFDYGFAEGAINFFTNVYLYLNCFCGFLFSIDLLHPGHLGFLLLLIFVGLGIRPSYIGEDKRRKVNMFYDLENIWRNIIKKPIYILPIILLSYVFSYVSFLLNTTWGTNNNWYVFLFTIFGWLSITAIVSIFVSQLLVLLVSYIDQMKEGRRFLAYSTPFTSYIVVRILFYAHPIEYYKTISLIIMIFTTAFVTSLLLGNNTNKFKTMIAMKLMREKNEGNGTKRIVKQ